MKILFKRILLLLSLLLLWSVVALYGGLSGWWLKPLAHKDDVNGFTSAIERKLATEVRGNVALVLIESGEVVYENYNHSLDEINRETLFPVASMSKFFTALGVLEFTEKYQASLDQPVAELINGWQLPESPFDHSKVTLSALLSHTAGLTDSLGFADYQNAEDVPNLIDSLNAPQAIDGVRAITVGFEPGSEWAYSGGGYLITELVVEEQTDMAFESWMQQSVFAPTGMSRATYDPISTLDNHSKSYDKVGTAAPLYYYASPAATGLSLSAHDLVQLLSSDLISRHSQALTQPIGNKLGAPIWGLGAMLYAPLDDAQGQSNKGQFIFGHDGSNEPAINSTLRINPSSGDALIVLSTGGDFLASQIGYEWVLWQSGYPDFLHFERAIASAWQPMFSGFVVIVMLLMARLIFAKRKQKRH
ncbi:serine hydrolase domain-containing protein [Planctobacterium marinum]|uniref:Beta-lactamase-related domain-containing protein n=1 Tax=Planctobacterium marinum TaxID=1631968 RepID=A0AA48HYY1_9ALTE|nr:hypothetical protein MACH26_27010 [Planctobacterium marinum]